MSDEHDDEQRRRQLPGPTPYFYPILPDLPLGPNGKLDRKALPKPEIARITDAGEAEPPRTPTEEILAGIWSQLLGREAIEPVELGGYPIPRGTTVFMTAWAIHRDARWFNDPDSFQPDRWDDGLIQRIPRYAYFPFGGGPRICIGNDFALMEATLVLATIAQKYRLRLAPDAVVTPMASMTLRPAQGLKMVLSRR